MSGPSNKYFAPKPGRFGKMIAYADSAFIGSGATATLTSSGTSSFFVGLPYRKVTIERLSVVNRTLPGFSAAGGGVATVFKSTAVGATVSAITASLTLDTCTSAGSSPFTFLTGLTLPNDLSFSEGDGLLVRVSLGTTSVTTAAADLVFIAEIGVTE